MPIIAAAQSNRNILNFFIKSPPENAVVISRMRKTGHAKLFHKHHLLGLDTYLKAA
jgi:hypothetical protein